MATHSIVLAWRIPGMGSLVGCSLWGRMAESQPLNPGHVMAKPTHLTVVGDLTLLTLNPALLALPWAPPAIRGHPAGA